MKKIFALVIISSIGAKAQKQPEDFGKYDTVSVDMLISDTSLPFINSKKFTSTTGFRVIKTTARHFIKVHHIDANKNKLLKNIVVLESKEAK